LFVLFETKNGSTGSVKNLVNYYGDDEKESESEERRERSLSDLGSVVVVIEKLKSSKYKIASSAWLLYLI
jgi:hypothetical protein